MCKPLLIIALCTISFLAGTFLTGSEAASRKTNSATPRAKALRPTAKPALVDEDPDFEATVTAGYTTIDWQTGVNTLPINNASESPEVEVNLTLSTVTGSFQNVENGREYRLLLIPVDER